jgi:hypothetical protein
LRIFFRRDGILDADDDFSDKDRIKIKEKRGIMNGIVWHICLDYVKKYIIKIETPILLLTKFMIWQ